MKKIILSAFALFAFGFANAQDATTTSGKGFSSGDAFISGTVGISSTTTGDVKSTSFNVTPMVGYFVSENIAIGGLLGYQSETADEFVGGELLERKTSAFSIGAFGRYYATPSSDFSFFGELGLAYVSAKSEYEDFGESKANGFAVAVSPGISYFISNHFALEATIGALSYSSVKPDADGADATNTFDLNLDLTDIQLGVVYKF